MPNITEHDGEQEREGDHSEETGVDFLIGGDTVAVHDGLETFGKLIRPVVRGRRLVRAQLM